VIRLFACGSHNLYTLAVLRGQRGIRVAKCGIRIAWLFLRPLLLGVRNGAIAFPRPERLFPISSSRKLMPRKA